MSVKILHILAPLDGKRINVENIFCLFFFGPFFKESFSNDLSEGFVLLKEIPYILSNDRIRI